MIETESFYISKVGEDIVKVISKPDAFVTVSEYETLKQRYFDLIGKEEDIKFLVIIQPGFKSEFKYSQFFKNFFRTEFKKAEAYIIKHPPSKPFYKVGLKLVPHKYPVKLFEQEEEALTWLQSIK